jgi:hypothetical protein
MQLAPASGLASATNWRVFVVDGWATFASGRSTSALEITVPVLPLGYEGRLVV